MLRTHQAIDASYHFFLYNTKAFICNLCRDTVVKYSNGMKDLAQRLLRIISESLNLPPSYIEEAVGEVYQNITISYYSPCPQPDLALGLQSHSDMGAITLLIQDDVGGLELLKDGMWIPVSPLPEGILVILADQTEVLLIVTLYFHP
jgi:isopenicillin N synthase-like dioxygenase